MNSVAVVAQQLALSGTFIRVGGRALKLTAEEMAAVTAVQSFLAQSPINAPRLKDLMYQANRWGGDD